ncbi:MAG: flagellar protein FlgN [Candidatus Latescibacterota bacterium]|nr:flagellar protein FlgN [Candidatus Latescibacterota bacterium]
MNEELLGSLTQVINEEVRVFNDLLDILNDEQKAIVEDNVRGIEECVLSQQEVASKAHELEARRQNIVVELSENLSLEADQVNLGRLLEVLEGSRATELARMREKLIDLNKKIRKVSANNSFLIRQSLRYTERCLDILTGQGPLQRGVYGQFGTVRRATGDRSFVNHTA